MSTELPHDEELDPLDAELASLLAGSRPAPAASFRGTLGRWLRDADPGFGPRPPRLWAIALGYLIVGLLALGLAFLVASGAI